MAIEIKPWHVALAGVGAVGAFGIWAWWWHQETKKPAVLSPTVKNKGPFRIRYYVPPEIVRQYGKKFWAGYNVRCVLYVEGRREPKDRIAEWTGNPATQTVYGWPAAELSGEIEMGFLAEGPAYGYSGIADVVYDVYDGEFRGLTRPVQIGKIRYEP